MAPIPDDEYSLLHTARISQYVSLPPAALATPLPALCTTIFSPLLLSYFPPARGIVLAYEDVALSSSAPTPQTPSADTPADPVLLRHVDEYAAPFLWATATFLIWRPEQHKSITAHVTHQSKTHLTLSHLNLFPVSILAEHLPPSWTFRQTQTGLVKKGWDGRLADEGGVWVDGAGEEVRGELKVRVRDFDGRMDGKGRGKGFLRIDGSLLAREEEGREKGKGKEGRGGRGGLKRPQVAGQEVETE